VTSRRNEACLKRGKNNSVVFNPSTVFSLHIVFFLAFADKAKYIADRKNDKKNGRIHESRLGRARVEKTKKKATRWDSSRRKRQRDTNYVSCFIFFIYTLRFIPFFSSFCSSNSRSNFFSSFRQRPSDTPISFSRVILHFCFLHSSVIE